MASLLRLDIILPSYFYGRTFLEQLQAWRLRPPTDFSLTPGNSDPQPDDTARKGAAPSGVNCTSTPRLSAGLGKSFNPAFARQAVEQRSVIAPGSTESTVFSSTGGNTYFATNGAEHAKLGRGNIHR